MMYRPSIRLLQSSAVVFRADVIQTSTGNHNTEAGESFLFNDNTRIFAVKKTSDILRSLFVLKMCSYDVVARKSMVVSKDYKCIKLIMMLATLSGIVLKTLVPHV